MRLLVTGSRTWMHRDIVWRTLDDFNPRTVIVGYDPEKRRPSGVDEYAYQWTVTRFGPQAETWPAHWDVYGKVAGFIRNQNMIDNTRPELVLAFMRDLTTGQPSPGTRDCVARALEAGLPVKLFREDKHGAYIGEDKEPQRWIGTPARITLPSVGRGSDYS